MRATKLPEISKLGIVHGRRVLVRASLDVPIKDGVVTNYFRIMRAMPTLLCLTHAGAKVILVTHVGRDPKETVAPLYAVLKEHLRLTYVPHVIGPEVDAAIEKLQDGSVLLLENVRSLEGEVSNDSTLGEKLASYADLYVNDAFAVSHREHASIVGISKHLPSFVGLTFYEEYIQLQKVIQPKKPSLFILGGAKFKTKEPLIKKYVSTYDHVFLGGALANDFFKAKGFEIGNSLVSETDLTGDPLLKNKKLLLPLDVTVDGPKGVRVTDPDGVEKDEKIMDAGPKTIRMLEKHAEKAKTILWNGPLGFYEDGFVDSTRECAKLVAKSSAYSVVGGGDTIASVESLALNDQFSFISTAGGAMMYFLEAGTLPGIEAVLKVKKHA